MNDATLPTAPPRTATPTAQTPPVTSAPAVPGGKEREPGVKPVDVTAEIAHPIPEIAIPDEVKEAGVESVTRHNPVIAPEAKKAGVTLAKPAQKVPVATDEPLKIPLPMTYDAAENVVEEKKYKFSDGVKWLAAEIAYQWRRINPVMYNPKNKKENKQ